MRYRGDGVVTDDETQSTAGATGREKQGNRRAPGGGHMIDGSHLEG